MAQAGEETAGAAPAAGEPPADDAFERGVRAMKAGKMEEAVQLLGQALQACVATHGDDALECASAYYRYGSALFYRAQEESDVFGAPLQSTVAADGEGPSTATAPAGPSGAAPAAAAAADEEGAIEAEAEEEDRGEDEDAADDEGNEGNDDMQLAWENLEVARYIFTKHKATHASELADVHMLLADLATEQESFETALEDLQTALGLLSATLQAHDRRLAELHYKRCLTLQFLQRPEEALAAAGEAQRICAARLQALGGQDAAAVSEAADLTAVLEELGEKQTELRTAVQELARTRDTLRAAFQQAVGGGGGQGGAAASQAAMGQVVDLGVVGRGKKRLNLAPLQPQQPAGEAKGKRSLEDLMGGGPAPTFSFQPAASEGPLPGAENKKPCREPQEGKVPAALAALPAFLQPGSVQAVYGQTPPADHEGAS